MEKIKFVQKMWNDVFEKESLELLIELGEYYDVYTNAEIISLELKDIVGWLTLRVELMLGGKLQTLVLGSANDIEAEIYQFNHRDIDNELLIRKIPKGVADMIEIRLKSFLDVVFLVVTD